MSYTKLALIGLAVLPWLAAPAPAQEHGRSRGRAAEHRPQWHGEINRFHEHDLKIWSSGRWYQGPHGGRHGWWWIVGGIWYFYPLPIYPYPDPYEPPIISVPPVQAAPQYWYYCADPAGYYPYVAQCRGSWQRVPATPPGAPSNKP